MLNIQVSVKDGVPILLGQIAEVKVGHEVRRGAVTVDGQGECVLASNSGDDAVARIGGHCVHGERPPRGFPAVYVLISMSAGRFFRLPTINEIYL